MSSAENEQVGGEGAMEDDDGIEDNIGMNLLQEQFTIETMNSKDTGAEIIDFINSLPTIDSQKESLFMETKCLINYWRQLATSWRQMSQIY